MKCLLFNKDCDLLTCHTKNKCLWHSDREKAMEWWNNLTFTHKWEFIVKNKDLVIGYPDRDANSLTGREIHLIWSKETNNPI